MLLLLMGLLLLGGAMVSIAEGDWQIGVIMAGLSYMMAELYDIKRRLK